MNFIFVVTALLLSTVSQAEVANTLTLHFVPSPTGINWKGPRALADSVLKNELARVNGGNRHPIAHVYEELNCGGQHLVTGATDVGNTQELTALMKQGYGLGVVLKDYVGTLDNQEAAEKDLAAMHATGRANFITFIISDKTCGRLFDYLKEYQARNYDKTYGGLNARPRRGEGSGCAAFSVSFLELAGLKTDEFEKEFSQSLIIPRRFAGGDLTRSRVSLLKILFAFSATWDKDLSKGGIPVHFYNPERMYDWTSQAVIDIETNPSRKFPWPAQVSYLGVSQGVTFEASSVPTPTEPMFTVPAPVSTHR